MAVSVSIQETTIVPTEDGYRVQLFVSDKPPSDEEASALALSLRVHISRTEKTSLTSIQARALEEVFEAMRLVLRKLRE